jgi:hypothetical protein
MRGFVRFFFCTIAHAQITLGRVIFFFVLGGSLELNRTDFFGGGFALLFSF